MRFKIILLCTLFVFGCSSDDANQTDISPDSDANPQESNENFDIRIVGLQDNQAVSENLTITIEKQEESAAISEIKASIDGEVFYESDAVFSFDLNPINLTTGNLTLTVEAIGENGKVKTIQVPFLLELNLLTISVPEGYFSQFNTESYAFLSDKEGGLIMSKKLVDENVQVNFTSPPGIIVADSFMLTIVSKNVFNAYEIETVQNLFYASNLDFKLKGGLGNPFREVPVTLNNIDGNQLSGLGYNNIFNSSDPSNIKLILFDVGQEPVDHLYILRTERGLNGPHSFAKIQRSSIGDVLELTPEHFSSTGVSISSWPSLSGYTYYTLTGYENQSDYLNDRGHEAKFTYGLNDGIYRTPFIDNFEFYRHQYSESIGSNEYMYLGSGLPLDSYTVPTWTTTANLNGGGAVVFSTDLTGQDLNLLKLRHSGETGYGIEWDIIFDGSLTDSAIPLAELPQELSVLANTLQTLEVYEVYCSDYKGIENYQMYIEHIKSKNAQYFDHSEYLEHFRTFIE